MKEQLKVVLQQGSVSNKVLITGIDGFTGIHLERLLLEKRYDVFGTVIKNDNNKHHFVCDIRKQEEIRYVIESVKPDYIFHLAGIAFVGEQNRSLIYDVNVFGTENLLEAIVKCKIMPHKIVVASSATIYGNQNASVLDETMCPKPVNHYGYSKLIMEHLISTYFPKLNILITRPFNYTGPNQTGLFLIPKIVSHFKERKEFIELGNINVAREFNNVTDISNLYYQLMLCETSNIIVNLCSGTSVYLMGIIEYLNNLAGYEIKIKVNPNLIRENEIPILKGSISRLQSLVSFQFQKDIQQTLNEMFYASAAV